MIVREATAADAAAVARVQVDSWQAAYQGIIEDAALRGLSVENKQAYWLQWFLRNEASRFMRVIDDEARAVGFAVGGPVRGRTPGSPDLPAVGEIYVLYLLPQVQRRGWGEQLMRSMARGLHRRGLEALLLWVLQRNHGACRFYEALGGASAYRRRVAVGRQTLMEVGYFWDDLSGLTGLPPGAQPHEPPASDPASGLLRPASPAPRRH